MGMSGKRHNSGGAHMPLSEINVTPMVDVMLVLLIIFMVTAPMMVSGVDLELPGTDAAPMAKTEEKPLVISVTKAGEIFLMEETIAPDALFAKAAALKQAQPKLDIVIRGDKSANYGIMMQVIADINRAGFTNISLLSDTAEKR
jgi:biopolymer transport protein TolR